MTLKCFGKNNENKIPQKKFVFVGDWSVGKSSLIDMWGRGKFPDWNSLYPHIVDNYSKNVEMDGVLYRVDLFNTSGRNGKMYYRLRMLTYRQTDLFILMFSCDSRNSFENIESKWLPEIRRESPGTPIVLICSKYDLRNEKYNLKDLVSMREAEELAARNFEIIAVAQNSSLRDINLENSLNACLRVSCMDMKALPFTTFKPFRVGDWVYAYRKGKWNIATIKDITDQRIKVFYFERQYWFNHHSIYKRAHIKKVGRLDMLHKVFAIFQPFGLEIPETIADHIAEYLTWSTVHDPPPL